MDNLMKATILISFILMPVAVFAESMGHNSYDDMPYKHMLYENEEVPYKHMKGDSYYEFCNECGTTHMHGRFLNTVNTEEEAKAKFEKYISRHMKGYKIIKMNSKKVRAGMMYWAILRDNNKNEMELHMNPWGRIVGPFVK